MRIRSENIATVAQRLRGESDTEPVSFIIPRVALFAHARQFRLLAPALNRPPMWPDAENPTLPTQHESDARRASGLERSTASPCE